MNDLDRKIAESFEAYDTLPDGLRDSQLKTGRYRSPLEQPPRGKPLNSKRCGGLIRKISEVSNDTQR